MAMTLKQMQVKMEAMRNRYNLLIEIIKKSPKLIEKVGKVMKHIPYQFEFEAIQGDLELFKPNYREIDKIRDDEKAKKKEKEVEKILAPQTNEVTQQAELK